MAYQRQRTRSRFNQGGLRPQTRDYKLRPRHNAISIDDNKARLLDDAFAVRKVIQENTDESYEFSFYVSDTSYYFDQEGKLPGPYIDRDGTVHNRPDITPNARYDMLSLNDSSGSKPAVRLSCTVSSSGRITDISASRVQLKNERAYNRDEADLALRNMQRKSVLGDAGPLNQLKLLKELATIIDNKTKEKRITSDENRMDAEGICEVLNNFGNYLFTLYAYQNKLPIIYQAKVMNVPLLGREANNPAEITKALPDNSDDIEDLTVHIAQDNVRYTTTPSSNLEKGYLAYARLSSPMQYVFDAVNMMTLTRHLDDRPNPFSKPTLDALVARQSAIDSNLRRQKSAAKQAARDDNRSEFRDDFQAMGANAGYMSDVLSECFSGENSRRLTQGLLRQAERIVTKWQKVQPFVLAKAIFENPNKTAEQQRLFKAAIKRTIKDGLSEQVLKSGIHEHGAYEAFYFKKGKKPGDIAQPILISASKNRYSLGYICSDENRQQVFDRLLVSAANRKLINLKRQKTRFMQAKTDAGSKKAQPR